MNRYESGFVPRRVITTVRDGRAVFVSDGPTPNVHHYSSLPGMMTSVLYTTAAVLDVSRPGAGDGPAPRATGAFAGRDHPAHRHIPAGQRLRLAQFRSGAASVAEQHDFAPDFAATFEPSNPGKHRTDSVDYDIVLDGEIWLELDEETVHLRAGDVVVQEGTRHAWRNNSDQPATLCFVLIGVDPEVTNSYEHRERLT